jgi:hypothetical protein
VKIAKLVGLILASTFFKYIGSFFMKKFISVFNFTILVVLILSIPLLDKSKADWNPSELSRIRVSTATGLDSLPSEKATSSGTSINYIINAFGIGYTTSTLTIDDSDVKVKKISNVLDLSVMTGIQSFTFQAGYGWLLSHKWDHPSYDTATNSSEGGSGFFNAGVDLGLFELTGGYRVWSIVHNVNKSWKNSNGNTQTSDEKDHLAYKEMYLGLGYIF